MNVPSELIVGAIVLFLFIGQYLLYLKFGKPDVDKILGLADIYTQAAWNAMLAVEQTIKGDPGYSNGDLKQVAIKKAVVFLHSVGIKGITGDELDMIGNLIEAALIEFKSMQTKV